VCVCVHPPAMPYYYPLQAQKLHAVLSLFLPEKNTRDPLYFLRGGGTFDVFTLRCWFVALRR
jgi:hypothetical protein